MPTNPENPTPDDGASAPSLLGGLNPDELFARGMQSVRMTGGGSMQNWEPPTVEEAARLFPNYKVLDVLGRGGMGAVYKAVQSALDRVVAIKLLPLEISIDRDFADRFVREARTMAKLNHPNIVSVFDFGTTTEGHLYFVMEFVEGTTLHHLIKTTGLKPTQCLELIVSVCEALQYAHGEGVVHRDIKPANVLVDTKGRVKVADFGLARMDTPSAEQWGQTMTGMVLGTPDYMAPEQKQGSRVDHRADIYSLGVMLYEMLCGQIPQGIFAPPSQRVTVDERVDQVVIRAMQQEPDRRYANTAEMKTEVENIRNTPLPQAASPASASGKKASTSIAAKSRVAEPAAAQEENEPRREKSAAPWLAGIAALCALVAVSVVVIQLNRQPTVVNVPINPPPAPELKPVQEPVVPGAIAAGPVESVKTENDPAKTEPPKAEPAEPKAEPALVATVNPPKAEPVTEPPVPVAPPPSEAPMAVIPVPQVSPSALVPATPAPVAVMPPAPAIPAVPEPGAVEDWRAYVTEGDALMNVRRRDEAMEAYLAAFDLATDGRQVPAQDVASLAKKVSQLQVMLGSNAEARQTLDRGRQTLKKMNSPKDAAERQKLVEDLENSLRRLMRE